MEAKLLKVKLQPNSRAKFEALLEFMQTHPQLPQTEMAQKGYFWDAFFIDNDDNLFMVLKSPDFSKIIIDDTEIVPTAFRDVYDKFRQECWVKGSYQDIEALFCFNDSLSFMGTAV